MRPLTPAATIRAAVRGNEVHAYELAVQAGEFVRVRGWPWDGDVALSVVHDGQVIARAAGFEKTVRVVSFIAAATGVHQVEVRSGASPEHPSRYQLSVAAWRPAGEGDAARVAADEAVEEAHRVRREGSQGSLRQALERHRQALASWRSLGETLAEADALAALGEVTFTLRDPAQARALFEQELPLRRAAGDARGEGEALHNLGVIHSVLGDRRKAIELYEQALPIRRALGDRSGEAQTVRNMGVSWLLLDEHQKAVDSLRASLPLVREAGDRRGEGFTLHSLGGLYFRLGDFDSALEHAQQALAIRRELGDRAAEAQTLQSIGLVHTLRGEHDAARGFYEQALVLVRATGDRMVESTVLQGLAEGYRVSDPARALSLHEQALAIHRQIENRPFESLSLLQIGTLLAARGDVTGAQARLEESLAIRREIADLSGEAQVLHALARLDLGRGDLDGAGARLESALAITDALRVKAARQDLRQSFAASRQELYEDHVELLMERHRRDPGLESAAAAFAASEHARARMLRDLLLEAGAEIRTGLDPASSERLRRAQDRLNASERDRLRVFSAAAPAAEREKARRAVQEALAEYQEVESRLRASTPRLAELRQAASWPARELQALLDPGTLALEYALGARRSYLFVVSRESVTALELPARAALDEAARRFRERLLASRHRAGQAAARQAARELSSVVLGPASALMTGRRLVFVPDGALHLVPFGALPGPKTGRPLVEDHEIVQLPALSVIASLRQDAESGPRAPAAWDLAAPRALAVLADPVLEASDPRVRAAPGVGRTAPRPADLTRSLRAAGEEGLGRLPFTRREAEAIQALAPPGSAFLALDFEASRATAVSPVVREARVVHFATHGLVDGEHPELSGLVLSLVDASGRPQDGFLRLHDIYNLQLGAELVVLSACRTAAGREVRGEGVLGLTRGFLYAGAPRVLASLWDVRDEASAELMRRFYRGLLREGRRPAAALRAAQVSLIREPRWNAPYYWAGFVLQGEWR
jgi:CHAT domain-containing protein